VVTGFGGGEGEPGTIYYGLSLQTTSEDYIVSPDISNNPSNAVHIHGSQMQDSITWKAWSAR
jgi:hypothetical protein